MCSVMHGLLAAAVMGNATASLYGDIKLARRFLCVWSVFLKKK